MFEAIFLLVIGAIWAAGKGDWSGIEMILKVVLYIGVFLSLFIPDEEPCMKIGCDRNRTDGSSYCYLHEYDY